MGGVLSRSVLTYRSMSGALENIQTGGVLSQNALTPTAE